MIDYTKRKNRGRNAYKLHHQKRDIAEKDSMGVVWVIIILLFIFSIINSNSDMKNKFFDKIAQIQNSSSKQSVNSSAKHKQNKKYSIIRFVNYSNQIRKVFWFNVNNNKKKLYKTLRPSQSYVQESYPHHMWLITDVNNNELARFYPKGAQSSVIMYNDYVKQTDGD